MSVTNLGILVPSTPGFVGPFHFFCSQALMSQGIPEATARLRKSLETTFGEDKVIVESQAAALRANPDAPLVNIGSDAGLVAARRLVDELIDRERTDVREPA